MSFESFMRSVAETQKQRVRTFLSLVLGASGCEAERCALLTVLSVPLLAILFLYQNASVSCPGQQVVHRPAVCSFPMFFFHDERRRPLPFSAKCRGGSWQPPDSVSQINHNGRSQPKQPTNQPINQSFLPCPLPVPTTTILVRPMPTTPPPSPTIKPSTRASTTPSTALALR